jgi:hypothetical protein
MLTLRAVNRNRRIARQSKPRSSAIAAPMLSRFIGTTVPPRAAAE